MKDNQWIRKIGVAAAVLIAIVIAAYVMTRCANAEGEGENGTQSEAGSSGEISAQGGEGPSGVTTSQGDASPSGEESTADASGHDHLNDALNGGNALDKYLTEQASIMMGMEDEMLIRESSGSASVDFLKGMIPHHEAAVSMSESYLKYGGEIPELEDMARDIITAQKKELDQMNELLKQYEADGEEDPEKETQYLEEYSKMFGADSMSHHTGHAAAENIDQAFAEGMIMHHKMAVDMAEDILEYTEYDEIRELAQNIIDVQTEEIERMKELAGV